MNEEFSFILDIETLSTIPHSVVFDVAILAVRRGSMEIVDSVGVFLNIASRSPPAASPIPTRSNFTLIEAACRATLRACRSRRASRRSGSSSSGSSRCTSGFRGRTSTAPSSKTSSGNTAWRCPGNIQLTATAGLLGRWPSPASRSRSRLTRQWTIASARSKVSKVHCQNWAGGPHSNPLGSATKVPASVPERLAKMAETRRILVVEGSGAQLKAP
ncbi:MAG: hypothetical protein JWO82_3387 [Akkermansiaceae bacterium]|nr:hypothetical protein [Akkermansiaceae bacterium]